MSSINRKKHLNSMTTKVSIFHNGENFICQTRKTSFHKIDGNVVFDDTYFFLATVSHGYPLELLVEEAEYLNKLSQLRAEKYVEEKYEYGFKFSDLLFKERSPYSHEYFGERPPNINETLKRFAKHQFDRRQESIQELKRCYPCKECQGKGGHTKLVGYEKRLVGSRQVVRGCLMPRLEREPCFEDVPICEFITCPACGGRGYDIEAILLRKKSPKIK